MKKLLTLIFLLIPGLVFGVTYYVQNSTADPGNKVCYKSGSWPDATCSDGTDNSDIDSVCRLVAASGDTVELDGGSAGVTYSGTQLDATDGIDTDAAKGVTLKGSSASGYDGQVTVDGTGLTSHTITLAGADTLSNIIITGAVTNAFGLYLSTTQDVTCSDFIVSGTDKGIRAQPNGAHTIILSNFIVKDTVNTSTCTLIGNTGAAAGTVKMSHGAFLRNAASETLSINDGTLLSINNINFVGNEDRVIQTEAGSDMATNITNCLFAANAYETLSLIIDIDGVTPTVSNSLLLNKALKADTYTWDAFTDGGGNIYVDPLFQSNRRTGIVVIGVDDDVNFEYWKLLADEADNFDLPMTLFLNTSDFADWSSLQTYVDNGHGVTSHTRYHTQVNDDLGFEIQYTGASVSCAMTLNVTTGLLTTTLAEGADLSYDLTNSSYDTLLELIAAINGEADYTCTSTSNSTNNDTGLTVWLVNHTAQDVKTAAFECSLNNALRNAEEFEGSATDIEAGLTNFVCDTFAYPYNQQDEDAQDSVKDAGYLGAKGNSGIMDLTDMQVFHINSLAMSTVAGSVSEASIKRNVSAMIQQLEENGEILVLGSHNAGEYTIANWVYVLEVLAESNIRVMTLSDAVNAIRNTSADILPTGTDADADGERWTRTFTDSSDYSLRSDSPCINVGTDPFSDGDGNQTDYADNPVWTDSYNGPAGLWADGVDIGAYGFSFLPGAEYNANAASISGN